MNVAKYGNKDGDLITIKQACERTNLGMSTIRQMSQECGASLKIGRSYRIDIQKLLEYLRTFQE